LFYERRHATEALDNLFAKSRAGATPASALG
jgi:hypothetical protein